jgi:hypothetical protein
MADTNSEAEQDPSIEDILHSIRQIISEDDEEEGGVEAAADTPEPEPEAAPAPVEEPEVKAEEPPADIDMPEPEPESDGPEIDLSEDTDDADVEDEVLDLTEKADENLDADDIDALFDEEENAPDIGMEDKPADEPVLDEDEDLIDGGSLLSDQAENAALAALGKLSGNMFVERQDHMLGITLEDIVREMMRPLLKDWLDNNLPKIVEKQVHKEIKSLVNKMQGD